MASRQASSNSFSMKGSPTGTFGRFCLGEENFFLFGDAQRERIDQRILRVARLKADLAADGGNAETISVTPDSTNYAVEDAAVFRGGLCTCVFACSDLAESP